MQNTPTLQQLYSQFQALCVVQEPQHLAAMQHLQHLQRTRLAEQYHTHFNSRTGRHALHLFGEYIYHHDSIFLLNRQLEEALKQKIKLERWLSKDLLETILHAYQMALNSLKLDTALLPYLPAEPTLHTLHVVDAYVSAGQLEARLQQLQDLEKLLNHCQRYANSFLMRSALRMAKSTLIRRGFAELYQFLSDCFTQFKGQEAAIRLMHEVIVQEKQYLKAKQHSQ